jgi:tRNA1(Val) A37 N6-methylase TrmN6
MIAAWRLPGARFVTVEAQQDSVRLARKSALYNGLTARYEIRLGDFREDNALARDERFDLILASPPYFPPGSGVESDHPQKIACRFETRGDIRDYARVAAVHLAPGGLFACVFPATDGRIDEAAHAADLTIVRKRPVVFREGESPLIALFAMVRKDDLPPHMRERTWSEPRLLIRCADGSVHPEYAAIKLAVGFPP